MSVFKQSLQDQTRRVETRLEMLFETQRACGTPPRLLAAMRHAVLGGGKRFRPFLVIESAALFGVRPEAAIEAAAALECVHCYSLAHDDLPAMDNDELRRGRPTVWRAYDEWTAILVGDALQALAFEILSRASCHPDADIRCALVAVLATASGAAGMVGGQALDLEASHSPTTLPYGAADVLKIQVMKTGRLISAACEMGAILGGADDAGRRALRDYSAALGFAFQLSDDLLDAEGGVERVGKATGKDAAAGKATLVSLLGIEEARRRLAGLVKDADAALAQFGAKGAVLAKAAHYMAERDQ